MNRQTLAEKIRTLRKQKGLRQEDLSAKAGVSIRVVKDLESASGNPTLESLSLVAAVLGSSIAQILVSGVEDSEFQVVDTPRPVKGRRPKNEDEPANGGFAVSGLSQPDGDTQGNKHGHRKTGKPPHKMSEEISEVSHSPVSAPNKNDFNSISLIGNISMRLPALNEDELSRVLRFMNDLASRRGSVGNDETGS